MQASLTGSTVRSRYRHFRNGLLRRYGQARSPCSEKEALQEPRRLQPSCEEGGHPGMVQAARERKRPVRYGTADVS